MARRPVNLNPRRFAESAVTESFSSSAVHQKSQSSPLLSVCLVLLGVVLLLCYSFSASDVKDVGDHGFHLSKMMSGVLSRKDSLSKLISGEEGDHSSRPECRTVSCQVIPLLQEVYGKSMNRVLHIGPGTCGVVLKLLKDQKCEVWGIQPFDPKPPVHSMCENLFRKGLVRVFDVSRHLPYRARSFSMVLVTDTVESLTGRHLNNTLPEFARVSSDGLVLLISSKGPKWFPEQASEKALKLMKPRNKEFWQRRLQLAGLQENEEMTKKFENLLSERSLYSDYYIFHFTSKISTR